MIEVAVIEGDAADSGLIARFVAEGARRVSGSAVFDDATDSWLLDGEQHARIVIDGRVLHQPSTPNYVGSNEFEGPLFHCTEWATAFDPRGKRIAVIGDRAAHVVPDLAGSEPKLFDCPTTWRTRKTPRRWLPRRRWSDRRPELERSGVERITPAGIRTVDGADHDADAIIFATGSIINTGLPDDALVGAQGETIQHAWRDCAASYFGIAVHGFPNYFMLMGPDSPIGERDAECQLHYIVECLSQMRRKGANRIEVRRSAQQQFTQRARLVRPSRAFDFKQHEAPSEIYDGPATLTVGGLEHEVRVRLTGHLDAIDGKYHWQGTVFAATTELPSRPVKLAIDSLTAQARITEQTPWGSYSIAGVGVPPFGLR